MTQSIIDLEWTLEGATVTLTVHSNKPVSSDVWDLLAHITPQIDSCGVVETVPVNTMGELIDAAQACVAAYLNHYNNHEVCDKCGLDWPCPAERLRRATPAPSETVGV